MAKWSALLLHQSSSRRSPRLDLQDQPIWEALYDAPSFDGNHSRIGLIHRQRLSLERKGRYLHRDTANGRWFIVCAGHLKVTST
ncbi:hypothetical protein BS17DRAFT_786784 [Gyrodon lividus]|nr:hypothetical protein BS17DRAFT_786784 [Gyrodon lividus]